MLQAVEEHLEHEERAADPTAPTQRARARRVVALLCIIAAYIAVGAVVYGAVELREEKEAARDARVEIAMLRAKYDISDADWRDIARIAPARVACGRCDGDAGAICAGAKGCVWRFSMASFFVATTISTVGYGSFAPSTSLGKALVAVLGVPGLVVVGWFMAEIAALVQGALDAAAQAKEPRRRAAIRGAVCLSGPATVAVFAAYVVRDTGWSFGNAAYFSFVTLSTIGYGDFVPDDPKFWNMFFVFVSLAVVAANLGVAADLWEPLLGVAHRAVVRPVLELGRRGGG